MKTSRVEKRWIYNGCCTFVRFPESPQSDTGWKTSEFLFTSSCWPRAYTHARDDGRVNNMVTATFPPLIGCVQFSPFCLHSGFLRPGFGTAPFGSCSWVLLVCVCVLFVCLCAEWFSVAWCVCGVSWCCKPAMEFKQPRSVPPFIGWNNDGGKTRSRYLDIRSSELREGTQISLKYWRTLPRPSAGVWTV